MDKQEILDNCNDLSNDQLIKYLRIGLITLDELKSHELKARKRREIEKELSALENIVIEDDSKGDNSVSTNVDEDYEWNILDKSDLASLREYKRRNPNKHKAEVLKLINNLRSNENREAKVKRVLRGGLTNIASSLNGLLENNEIEENDIIDIFRKDPNIVPPKKAAELRKVIDIECLEDVGIDHRFIKELSNPNLQEESHLRPSAPPLLNSIPKGYTEVYFWGVPGSGKTCAAGAIMSALKNNEAGVIGIEDSESQGSAFMMPLASLFIKDEICILPTNNKVGDTFEMRFDIRDRKNKEHKIAFIDMAGELYECLYYLQSNQKDKIQPIDEFEASSRKKALRVLEKVLIENRTDNPKIHFFVIEYGSHNKRYTEDKLLQKDLLSNLVSYLKNKKILETNTAGVYILVTKCDKANESIEKYLNNNYRGFIDSLKPLMADYGINTKKGKPILRAFDFSIGEVCFQKWCLYNPQKSIPILKEIQERTNGIQKGKIGSIINIIKK